MEYHYAIALTGGIASGKSTVASLLKLYGFSIIDADTIAHLIVEEQKEALVTLFGTTIVENGHIHRKKLGEIIFTDSSKRATLEALVHPLIHEKILAEAAKLETKKIPYILDIPLFFETGTYPFSHSVVVYTPRKTQYHRLVAREGLTKLQADARLNAQLDIEEKKKRAWRVVDNSGTLKELQSRVEVLATELKERIYD